MNMPYCAQSHATSITLKLSRSKKQQQHQLINQHALTAFLCQTKLFRFLSHYSLYLWDSNIFTPEFKHHDETVERHQRNFHCFTCSHLGLLFPSKITNGLEFSYFELIEHLKNIEAKPKLSLCRNFYFWLCWSIRWELIHFVVHFC